MTRRVNISGGTEMEIPDKSHIDYVFWVYEQYCLKNQINIGIVKSIQCPMPKERSNSCDGTIGEMPKCPWFMLQSAREK